MIVLVVSFTVTAAGVGVVLHSLAAALLTFAMGSLSLVLLVLGMAVGPDWPRERPLQRWERLTVLWLMAATGAAGVVFLFTGAAAHHGSWTTGLVGFTAAVASGVVAVRAFLAS